VQARTGNNSFAESPRPIAQNLTVRALQMKGVPEPDIAAAIDSPERMKPLYQNYGPGSTATRSASGEDAVAPIGDNRASTIAALRGIPLAGADVDQGTAWSNGAADIGSKPTADNMIQQARSSLPNQRQNPPLPGRGSSDICAEPGMPCVNTVRQWAADDIEGFASRYSRAREIGGPSRRSACRA
jgi:hypothetical protein